MTEDATKTTNILDLVNKTVELPTIPDVLIKLNKVIADPDASAEHVASEVSKDPAIATNVLRLVNSAYFGLPVRVSAVSTAVSIMGFRMTKKVALKAAVFSVFGAQKDKLPHFDPEKFWMHSTFTGVAARSIGKVSPRFQAADSEDLYICGLLHDIGKIILHETMRDRYADALAQAAASGRPELEVEGDVLGFNHADVGSVLAIKWFLPEDLTIAIRYHHAPGQDPFHQSLSSLIHLADHLAWSSGNSSTKGTTPPEFDLAVYDQVGVDARQIEDILPQIREDFELLKMPW
jgi:HD-like signal output (HDOD) protein